MHLRLLVAVAALSGVSSRCGDNGAQFLLNARATVDITLRVGGNVRGKDPFDVPCPDCFNCTVSPTYHLPDGERLCVWPKGPSTGCGEPINNYRFSLAHIGNMTRVRRTDQGDKQAWSIDLRLECVQLKQGDPYHVRVPDPMKGTRRDRTRLDDEAWNEAGKIVDVFGSCQCGSYLHRAPAEAMVTPPDICTINSERLSSDYCAATGVGAYPFYAWHRSEPSGLVAHVTHVAPSTFTRSNSLGLGFVAEYAEIIHGTMGGEGSPCAEAMRRYICYSLQPQCRLDRSAQKMETCGVCRDVCTDYINTCDRETIEAFEAVVVSALGNYQTIKTAGLCYVGREMAKVKPPAGVRPGHESLSEPELAYFIEVVHNFSFPDCSGPRFRTDSCSSADQATCQGPKTTRDSKTAPRIRAPIPVAQFRDFASAAGSVGGKGDMEWVEELYESRGLNPSMLVGSGHVERVPVRGGNAPTHALRIPPDSTLTLVGEATKSNSRGRVDQYTVIMDSLYDVASEGDRNVPMAPAYHAVEALPSGALSGSFCRRITKEDHDMLDRECLDSITCATNGATPLKFMSPPGSPPRNERRVFLRRRGEDVDNEVGGHVRGGRCRCPSGNVYPKAGECGAAKCINGELLDCDNDPENPVHGHHITCAQEVADAPYPLCGDGYMQMFADLEDGANDELRIFTVHEDGFDVTNCTDACTRNEECAGFEWRDGWYDKGGTCSLKRHISPAGVQPSPWNISCVRWDRPNFPSGWEEEFPRLSLVERCAKVASWSAFGTTSKEQPGVAYFAIDTERSQCALHEATEGVFCSEYTQSIEFYRVGRRPKRDLAWESILSYPAWVDEAGGRDFTARSSEKVHPGRRSCLLSNPDDEDDERGRCSLLSVMDGCMWKTGTGSSSFNAYAHDFDLGECGSAFYFGGVDLDGAGAARCTQPPESCCSFHGHFMQLNQSPRTRRNTTQGMWTRVVLSVDLHANYVRAYANVGDGPSKVMDEKWLFHDKDKCEPVAEYIAAYKLMGVEGQLALSSALQVASDEVSTSLLGGLTVYHVAMDENDLERLAQPAGGAASFLLEVYPRTVLIAEGSTARENVSVKLLHPPLSDVQVSLALMRNYSTSQDRDFGSVSISPPRLSFDRGNWQHPQFFEITVKDDDIVQAALVSDLSLRIVSTEETAWYGGLDDTFTLSIQDDDVARLVARFDPKAIETATVNISSRSNEPSVFEHRFKLPPTDCPQGYTCIETEYQQTKIGSIEVNRNSNATYSLSLGSKPAGKVTVRVQVRRVGQGDSLVVASPDTLEIEPDTWDMPREVRLRLEDDDFEVSALHSLEHALESEADSQYNTLRRGVLPADVFAVKTIEVTNNMTISDKDSAVNSDVILAVVLPLLVFIVLILWRFRVKSRHLKNKVSEAHADHYKALRKASNLSKENALLKKNLEEAEKIVKQVVSEGGTALDKYKISHSDLEFKEALGEGSYGTVFKALYAKEGRHGSEGVQVSAAHLGTTSSVVVAVKTMRTAKVTQRAVEEFMSEIKIMAPLQHPNLVALLGGCWTDGPDKLCLVLEYCKLGSVASLMRKVAGEEGEGMLWKRMFSTILGGVVECFRYLHGGSVATAVQITSYEPIIHRDLKPDNVLLSEEMSAKVADFGESRHFDQESAHASEDTEDLVATMSIVGTPMYLAPEIVLTNRYNTKVDVFSFAVMLFEIACICVGKDARYVSSQFRRQGGIVNIAASGWRPVVPGQLEGTALIKLVRAAWSADSSSRPSFDDIKKDPGLGSGALDVDEAHGTFSVADDESRILSRTIAQAEAVDRIKELEAELRAADLDAFPKRRPQYFSEGLLASEWHEVLGLNSKDDIVAFRQKRTAEILAIMNEESHDWRALRHQTISKGILVEWKATSDTEARLYRVSVPLRCEDPLVAYSSWIKSVGTFKQALAGDRTVDEYRVLVDYSFNHLIDNPNSLVVGWQTIRLPRPLPKRYFLGVFHCDEDNLLFATSPVLPSAAVDKLLTRSVPAQSMLGVKPGILHHYAFKFERSPHGTLLTVISQVDITTGESAYHGILRNMSSINVDRTGVALCKGIRGIAKRINELTDDLQAASVERAHREHRGCALVCPAVLTASTVASQDMRRRTVMNGIKNIVPFVPLLSRVSSQRRKSRIALRGRAQSDYRQPRPIRGRTQSDYHHSSGKLIAGGAGAGLASSFNDRLVGEVIDESPKDDGDSSPGSNH